MAFVTVRIKNCERVKIMHVKKATTRVLQEYNAAASMFVPFSSNHQAYAVLKEEFDELWDEIKHTNRSLDVKNLEHEAVQVAAMALRFLTDRC